MASSIDATKPTSGNALTSDVRANFDHAKTEIEALQTLAGSALQPGGALGTPASGDVSACVAHPRVGNTASSATPTINTDANEVYRLTAQAADITSMTTNLTGTPSHDDALIIEITGTAARAITWGTKFEASTVALPTTTVSTSMLTVAFLYNSASSKWRCVGVC